MSSIVRQINIDPSSHVEEFRFEVERKDKVHEFFQMQPFDTVKHCQDGKREFLSKKALRKTLSQENGGAWIEEKDGKKRYFIDDSGWFQTSYKQVSKKEYLQKLESPSTIQKVLGIGLGVLALSPGMVEFAKHIPKEMGMGLLALQQKSPLLGALGYSLIPSSVEAQAMGTEFQVNSYTSNYQQYPAIAALVDGGFVIAWQSIGQDGDGYGIFAQRYDAFGAFFGSEFQVNNYTTSNQVSPAIALLNDGGFIVVWQSNGQDGDLDGIFAQRYQSNGAILDSEFQVNTNTTSAQQSPVIAPLNDGGFVIAWQGGGIYAQKYDAGGALAGSEFQVNNYTTGSQVSPAIAPLNDGGFVVAWQSSGQDGDLDGIFAQRYNANGSLFGPEFQVNNYTSSYQQLPSVAPLNDGGFVIAWQSSGQDGDLLGVFAQRYVSTGAIFGSEFPVNNYTSSSQQYPAIAPLNDGGFVITWQSNGQDGAGFGIFSQRYAATGTFFGPEFQVNNYTASQQQNPAVAPLNDGGFVITWQSDGADGNRYGIAGQRYDQNGSPVPLIYVPSMSSASSLGSNAADTNFPDSRLGLESSSTIATTLLSSISSSATANGAESSSSIFSPPTSSISGMQTGTSLSSGFGTPDLADVVYDQNYTVTQNGQTIGTFTISGGNGPYSSSNPNTLEIEFDPNYVLQDGDTFTIFSVPEGEELQWEGITFSGGEECFSAEGELVPNQDTNQNDYQVIFNVDEDQCSIYSDASKFAGIPVLAGGGLI